jgi:hypothetical protein
MSTTTDTTAANTTLGTSWWLHQPKSLVAHPERGASISVLTAGLLLSAALFLGLVMDGGAKASALNRADATAQEAARAGTQAASTTGTGATVNVADAVAASQSYLVAAGVQGTASAVGTDGIHVTVTITEPTKVLAMIGIDTFTASGSADARILYVGS